MRSCGEGAISFTTMDSVDSGALENLQLKPHIFCRAAGLGQAVAARE